MDTVETIAWLTNKDETLSLRISSSSLDETKSLGSGLETVEITLTREDAAKWAAALDAFAKSVPTAPSDENSSS